MPDGGLTPIFEGYRDDPKFPYIGLSDECLMTIMEKNRQNMALHSQKTKEQKNVELKERIASRVAAFRPYQS